MCEMNLVGSGVSAGTTESEAVAFVGERGRHVVLGSMAGVKSLPAHPTNEDRFRVSGAMLSISTLLLSVQATLDDLGGTFMEQTPERAERFQRIIMAIEQAAMDVQEVASGIALPEPSTPQLAKSA